MAAEEAPARTESTPTSSFKLFIGQIPKDNSEDDLRFLFEPFGKIVDWKILRDNSSGTSKGCGFLEFDTKEAADTCIAQLHGQHTFTGMKNAIQVKYSHTDTERQSNRQQTQNQKENKLFVGQISGTSSEEEVRAMFAPFGAIEDVAVLKRPDGSSRGCGFVRFVARAAALAAIQELDGKLHMEGARQPLQVRFAETESAKQVRQRQQGMMPPPQMGQFGGFGGGGGFGGMNPAAQAMNGYGAPGGGGMMDPGYGMQQQQQQQQAPWLGNPGAGGGGGYPNQPPQQQQQGMGMGMGMGMGGGGMGMGMGGGGMGMGMGMGGGGGGMGMGMGGVAAPPRGPKPAQGPPNANLFVYNIPQEYTDTELYQCFSPFGTVVSTKVFVDPHTQRSKGFGFVSYALADSAQVAIQSMNGMMIAGRKLKVALKRPGGGGGGAKPY